MRTVDSINKKFDLSQENTIDEIKEFMENNIVTTLEKQIPCNINVIKGSNMQEGIDEYFKYLRMEKID